MSELDSLRFEIDQLLATAERWLTDGLNLGLDPDQACAGLLEDAAIVRESRVRAASNLLNVAFLGGFSSGKSFLIGGLQKHLQYVLIDRPDELISEQYLGLLHSTAKVATACPAMVIPVASSDDYDVSRHGFFRVRFEAEQQWTDIGNSPRPGEVAAYTTDDPRVIADWRPPEHRNLKVAEVQILLGESCIPAKLCDLPGFGAPNVSPEHDRISREAWKAADCFIYTVQATHTLSQDDLDLIYELYQEHLRSNKRVIWVMTGIDRAAMRNINGQPEWTDARDANNNYLRNLGREVEFDASRVNTFIGAKGFLCVSPAWEAQGVYLQDHQQPAHGKRLIAESNMDRLRDELTDMIDSGAGKRHIAQIAAEARELVLRRHLPMIGIYDAARLPLAQIAAERNDLGNRLAQLHAAARTVRELLDLKLRDAVKRVDRSFPPLINFLRDHLIYEISQANVLNNKRDIGRIETQKVALLKTFAAGWVVPAWQANFDQFLARAAEIVRLTLRDTESSTEMARMSAQVDLEQLRVPAAEKYRTTPKEFMKSISGVVGIASSAAGVIAATFSATVAPIVAVPAAAAVIAGVVFAALRTATHNRTQIDMARQAMIAGLDNVANTYRIGFLSAAHMQGMQVIDRVGQLITERMEDMSRRIILLDNRLSEPDNVDRSELIARLEPHLQAGRSLIDGLKAISK